MADDSRDSEKTHKRFGLSDLAVNNRVSVIILTLIIGIMGIYSYISMPKESFPEIVIPQIYVGTSYPGNSPLDMERLITRPLEKEIQSVDGVDEINSTSIQGYSTIIVKFDLDKDVTEALREVKDAVDRGKTELPNDLKNDPEVFDINTSEFPVMNINLSGDFSLEQLKDHAEYLEEEFEQFREISDVELKGAPEREVKINADPHAMEAREISFHDIANAVSSENVTMSAGNLHTGEFRRSLRITGEFDSVAGIKDIIVKHEGGNIVYLRDIADVSFGYEDRESYSRQNRDPVVTLNVIKRSGENLLNAAKKIDATLDDARENRFPEGLNISITNDQSDITERQVSNLENSIVSGVILVVLVLLFFLGLRNALFVGIAIPLSMFMAFMILNALGITLNLVVLFSLILALGMLVDNGIVVVENIYRLMQEGYTPIKAAKEGVGEVALPIITSTATTLAAFLPLAFWESIVGEFMKYLPITLIIVLACSLFVALVINPVLTSIYMRVQTEEDEQNTRRSWLVTGVLLVIGGLFYWANLPFFFGLFLVFAMMVPLNTYVLYPSSLWFQKTLLVKIENLYDKTIRFALDGVKPYLFFVGTIILLVVSVALLIMYPPKTNFFPENEPQYVNVFIEKPVGTGIEVTDEFTQKLEDIIIKKMQPYDFMVEAVIAQVGKGSSDPSQQIGGGNEETPNKARITVSFKEYEKRKGVSTSRLMEMIRESVQGFPGVEITVDKNQQGPPVGNPVNMEIRGEDYGKLVQFSRDLRKELNNENINGLSNLKSDLNTGKPELIVDLDRDKVRRFGLSTEQVASTLRTALFGREVSKLKQGEDDYPIRVRLKEESRESLEALLNQKITFRDQATGKIFQVPVSSVADIRYSSTYGSVKRKDLERVISLYSNVEEGATGTEVVGKIKNYMKNNVDVPEGLEIKFTGEQEEQKESQQFLLSALLIAVFTIFLIIVSQFNSVATPFMILASVIFSTTGVFLGLVVFQMNFVVVMTGIGIISLAGVVVNNAIVLIDYTNLVRQWKKQELGIPEDQMLPYNEIVNSIITGGKIRLRPVLLTAITTIFGLVPLAIGLNIDFYGLLAAFEPRIYYGGDNANFWGPMAWTVIFGLTLATFLTLVIVPVMYLLVDKIKLWWRKNVH